MRCTSMEGGYSATQCETLQSVAKPYKKNSKGLLYQSRVNTSTMERLGTSITLQDNGENITLSLCPFCGGLLRDLGDDEIEYLAEKYGSMVEKGDRG